MGDRRTIACVNACSKMADPEKEIAAMREALREAHEALGRSLCWDLCDSIWGRPCDCGREAALTKLQPFIK